MMRITKHSVRGILDMFGSKEAVDIEHEALMKMLGAPMESDDDMDDEEGYSEKAGGMKPGMDGKGMHGKGAPKMMALKIMLGEKE